MANGTAAISTTPKNGKEDKSYIRLKDAQTLSLRGYIGISLLGRTELWKRAG